jgi:hypothetical protein
MDHNLYLDNSNVFIEGQQVSAAYKKSGRLTKEMDEMTP